VLLAVFAVLQCLIARPLCLLLFVKGCNESYLIDLV
jgi:hypothetical protein